MNTILLKTNINCGNCVTKVTPYFNNNEGITSWAVNTTHADKILTVSGHKVTAQLVADILQPAGFKVLGVVEQKKAVKTIGFFTTYKPLLLILAFIIGGVIVREAIAEPNGRFIWHSMMANFMGGFFLAFSFFKLLDVKGFASSYRMYDFPAKYIPFYAEAYPFMELVLAFLYFTGIAPTATNWVTLLLMIIGVAGVANSLLNKKAIRCACLGTVFNLPMGSVTLIEDGTMAVMAVTMLLL
jgi:copper chaperone CopZ